MTPFPLSVASVRWVPVTAGGFSGAAVWRGGDFALKRYPAGFDPIRLKWIHAHLSAARSAGCTFVPDVIADADGNTVREADGHVWDVTTWMPGEANFREHPTEAKLHAACDALAKLHGCWFSPAPQTREGPEIPAISRRLRLLAEWRSADVPAADSPLADARRAVHLRFAEAVRRLREWEAVSLPLQPCLCDVWHDHLLFTGDALTGLIDFGAMKIDTPAVDLARMLGDLIGTAHPWFELGLRFYREVASADVPAELVRLLADTADVCGVANWLLRWPRLAPGERARAADRLRKLLSRLPPTP